MSREEDLLAEEIAAVREQERQKADNIKMAIARRSESAAMVSYGSGGPSSVIQAEIVSHVENSLQELSDVIGRKGNAKEMAQALRPAAMLTLAKDMLSVDSKISQGAALQILNRSDGTGKGEDDKPPLVVNIMNVTNEELARRLAFVDRLREERNVED